MAALSTNIVVERDVRVFRPNPFDDGAPQLRHLQNVRLVDRGQSSPPASSRIEGDSREPFDLQLGTRERVDGPIGTGFRAARRPVVDASCELANDEQIRSRGDLRPEHPHREQRLVDLGGSQVREAAELTAET